MQTWFFPSLRNVLKITRMATCVLIKYYIISHGSFWALIFFYAVMFDPPKKAQQSFLASDHKQKKTPHYICHTDAVLVCRITQYFRVVPLAVPVHCWPSLSEVHPQNDKNVHCVFVSSSYCNDYMCCRKCSMESIDQLAAPNYYILFKSARPVIKEIEKDPQLLYNATYKRSLVTLTKLSSRTNNSSKTSPFFRRSLENTVDFVILYSIDEWKLRALILRSRNQIRGKLLLSRKLPVMNLEQQINA